MIMIGCLAYNKTVILMIMIGYLAYNTTDLDDDEPG